MRIAMLFILTILFSCNTSVDNKLDEKVVSEPLENKIVSLEENYLKAYREVGFVDIKEIDDRILIDLRYASANNFMHTKLYDTISSIYLQKDVAIKLSKVQSLLDSLRPNYRLLIFDGVRPLQVQEQMWNAMDTIPVAERSKFVSNPKNGSVHNFGAAVDLTIVNAKGKQLDMGAGYDDFRDIAFPSKESYFIKTGELTKEQLKNRKLLRKVMSSQGFKNIPSEWWHFNAFRRDEVIYKYPQLISESGTSVILESSTK